MKFQNPSFKFFFERTDGQTNGRTSRKQYAPYFFKVGGITDRLQEEQNLYPSEYQQFVCITYYQILCKYSLRKPEYYTYFKIYID